MANARKAKAFVSGAIVLYVLESLCEMNVIGLNK